MTYDQKYLCDICIITIRMQSNKHSTIESLVSHITKTLEKLSDNVHIGVNITWKDDSNPYRGSSSTYLFYDNPKLELKRQIDHLEGELATARNKMAKLDPFITAIPDLNKSESVENVQHTTDMFKCEKCKQSKCTYYAMQTRSLDESMKNYIKCVNCEHTWIMKK